MRKPLPRTRGRKLTTAPTPELTNIVKTAIRIIAGSDRGEVARAARIIGVSEPTLYRWRRTGNMLEARGAEVLRMHELTGLPVELLLKGWEGNRGRVPPGSVIGKGGLEFWSNPDGGLELVALNPEAQAREASLFPTLEAASRIYDVPLNTLRWWIQTGKLGPESGLCYIGKAAHLDARRFENSLLQRRGPRSRGEGARARRDLGGEDASCADTDIL
jgi:transposase-like protein